MGNELREVNDAINGSETDRGCALIAGAIAENAVQEILRLHAFQVENKNLPTLFDFEAPLGRFSDNERQACPKKVIRSRTA